MGDIRAIFKSSGKIPCFIERLKTCLIGLSMFPRQRLTVANEISSKPGPLLAFKLLNASFNSSLNSYIKASIFQLKCSLHDFFFFLVI